MNKLKQHLNEFKLEVFRQILENGYFTICTREMPGNRDLKINYIMNELIKLEKCGFVRFHFDFKNQMYTVHYMIPVRTIYNTRPNFREEGTSTYINNEYFFPVIKKHYQKSPDMTLYNT